MTIRAVFFDMGGTIETFWHSPELRLDATPDFRQKLQEAGIHLHLDDQKLCDVVTAGLDRYHLWSIETLNELPVDRVWREYILSDFKVDPGLINAAAEELMVFIEMRFYCRQFRPEVPQVLAFIRDKGLRIGLISNVCSQSQVPHTLKKYGILEYFNPLVLSSEYGRRKPDPAIFHYAARLANVPTSECLYVGDRIARDIVGARKAGFRLAVQIINDFDHGEEDTGSKPDAVITSMTELIDILKVEQDHSSRDGSSSAWRNDQVRAILFDAGDILYYRPERGRKFLKFLESLGLAGNKIPDETKENLKQQAFHGLITQDQYHEAVLHQYGIKDPELLLQGKQAMAADENDIRFFKGVRETLITLKRKGYMLGIITDTANPIHVKLKWFEKGGFGHVWDSIISSHDLGIQKPAPEIYEASLQQLGLSAIQAAFVGHDVDELNGAKSIGLNTIAFNYGQHVKADFYIEKFADLLSLPLVTVE